MKKTYISPCVDIQIAHLEGMLATSLISQNVYIDDPLTTDQALVKGQDRLNDWEIDW